MHRIVLLVALVACRSKQVAPAEETSDEADESAGPAFRVEVAPPTSCAVAVSCEAKVHLTALDGFKVNDQYPHKFVADKGSAVTLDETSFTRHGNDKGTLSIKFRTDSPGTAKITGTFRLSVCTPKICKTEAPKIAIDVPVT